MELHQAALYFDRDPFYDGYTTAFLFKGQTASFDDSSADGATIRRRVLSLAPGLSIPFRRVVSLYDEKWIIGQGTPDGFDGREIRQNFVMKKATDLFSIVTPTELLANAIGVQAYGQKLYYKDTVNNLTDSEYDTQWNIFLAPTEPAQQGMFLRGEDGRVYRIRNDYVPAEGLRVNQSDVLDRDSFPVAIFNTGVYNPVTEVTSAGILQNG